MNKIDYRSREIPFTQVANGLLYDQRLTLGAKAIFAYLYSKPNGWDFASDRIAKELNVSKPTVLKHLKELKECGYLLMSKLSTGRMLYEILYEPESKTLTEEPESKKATVKKSHGEESLPLSNKDIKVIKSNSNKDNNSEQSSRENIDESKTHDEGYDIDPVLVAEVINQFITVDPKNKTYFNNKAQRKASAFLIGEYGYEDVVKRITFLPKSNRAEFFPRIYTPVQLRDKWKSLEDAVVTFKQKSEKHKVAF